MSRISFLISSVLVAQLSLILCDPIDCSMLGSSVHGILQARIMEWIAIPFSRGSFLPRDWTQVSSIAGGFFTIWATREAPSCSLVSLKSHPWGGKEFRAWRWGVGLLGMGWEVAGRILCHYNLVFWSISLLGFVVCVTFYPFIPGCFLKGVGKVVHQELCHIWVIRLGQFC